MALLWIGVFAAMGPLAGAGVSKTFVYGAGAWLVVGVGPFTVLLERAAEITWRQRA